MTDPVAPQQPAANAAAAALRGATPRMAEADERRSATLSLEHAQPPLKVRGYEQEQFLGRGAFGEVWRAVDSNSGRVVAIKFYNHRGGLDWSHMAREVEKLQYLFGDRHVVQLFDVGWQADPPYYVMKYMDHGSLEDLLEQGPLAVPDAVRMLREIALGLAHAHDKGILHCDLKPGNIMLDQDGRPRLADFGQARLKHERAPTLGTLFYMAPEQADLSAAPDARWDVYALGVMLYRMITGKLPYLTDQVASSLSSLDSLEARLRSYRELPTTAPPPAEHRRHPEIDRALAEIIDHCLAIDPRRRYPNAQSVLHALAEREQRRANRPLLVLGLLGPATVLALMVIVGWLLFRQTLATASRHLLARTAESNQFAAGSVAERFALEIDKRWRILEQEAAAAPLPAWLRADATPADAEALQRWLEDRHRHWNEQFSEATRSSYWFVLDTQGKVRAISPAAPQLIGNYFGYREYFHGQGRELNPNGSPPPPIRRPHRSNVFRSQPTERPAVAFSVPVWGVATSGQEDSALEARSALPPTAGGGAAALTAQATATSEADAPWGVLAMEAELGHFADFRGSRNQVAVLLDLRPDELDVPGLIVEHPQLVDRLDGAGKAKPYYLAGKLLDAVARRSEADSGKLETEALKSGETDSQGVEPPPLNISADPLMSYRDPLDEGAVADDWLASVAPVVVSRGEDREPTGWTVLVQERKSETLLPLRRVRSLFLLTGTGALLIACLIVAGLWWLVAAAINSPRRLRAVRFWSHPTPHSTRSGATSTSSVVGASSAGASSTGASSTGRRL